MPGNDLTADVSSGKKGVLAKSLDNGFRTTAFATLAPIPSILAPGFNKPYLAPNDKPFPANGIPPPKRVPSCANFTLLASLAAARSLPVFPSSDTLSTNKVGLSASDTRKSAAPNDKPP